MKTNRRMKGIGKLLVIIFTCSILNFEVTAEIVDPGYDTTRIFKAMAKARRGENITIGVIGGSITQGSLASSVEKRWANLMTDWWKTKFPQSTVTLVNAGWGGTGSDIGTHRVKEDLLKYNPDFVVVEFAVNDVVGTQAVKMMEGLIRQILVADSLPGVMILTLKQADGVSAVTSHKQVADHYLVPLVNFAAMIDTAIANDGITNIKSIYGDSILHPNDIGMAYIADFLKYELNHIYSVLPADSLIDTVNTELPPPLITDTYAHTYKYTNKTLVPTTNMGWEVNSNGWIGHNQDDEITFTVDGNAISFLFTQIYASNWGQAEAWIDDGAHKSFDCYFNETWGTATRFALVGEGLTDGNHTLHVKITGNNSSGSTGHDFQILNVQKAGNFESAAPIANAGTNIKSLTDDTVPLIGTGFDPDNDTIQSYTWSIISKPAESINTIINESKDTASFIPDVAGYYLIGLIINDGHSNSVIATKVIHAVASNEFPVASAGNDSTVATMKFCTLNGNLSNDNDGDPLFFSWRMISQPVGSTVLLNLTNTPNPNFRPRVEGEYIIGLTVNDSLANSAEDEIIISAVKGYSSIDQNSTERPYLKAFPNPVNDQLNVEYYLNSPGKFEICIYNISGQKLAVFSSEFMPAGLHNYNFNLDPAILTNGLYFIVLKTNQGLFSDQFIIE
jgi:hypothetical protein